MNVDYILNILYWISIYFILCIDVYKRQGYTMADGRKLYVLAEGRLVNLAAGDGHPAEIMDLSFAMQALAAEHILHNGKDMDPKVYVCLLYTSRCV